MNESCSKWRLLAELDAPYVEIGDNVDGMMTNPRLFEQYSMATYQRLSEMAHSQGKKIGSHMDGDLKPIVSPVEGMRAGRDRVVLARTADAADRGASA